MSTKKILNNDDLNLKYKAAENYYNNGEYRRLTEYLNSLFPHTGETSS